MRPSRTSFATAAWAWPTVGGTRWPSAFAHWMPTGWRPVAFTVPASTVEVFEALLADTIVRSAALVR